MAPRPLPLQILLVLIHLHNLVKRGLRPPIHGRSLLSAITCHVLLAVLSESQAARGHIQFSSIVGSYIILLSLFLDLLLQLFLLLLGQSICVDAVKKSLSLCVLAWPFEARDE